jgi:hypothetical protein
MRADSAQCVPHTARTIHLFDLGDEDPAVDGTKYPDARVRYRRIVGRRHIECLPELTVLLDHLQQSRIELRQPCSVFRELGTPLSHCFQGTGQALEENSR